MDPLKNHFFSPAQLKVPVWFDISRYLANNYLDIVWGCHPPGEPPTWTPQKSIFETAQLRVPVCYDIRRYLTDNYFDSTFLKVPLSDIFE